MDEAWGDSDEQYDDEYVPRVDPALQRIQAGEFDAAWEAL